MTPANVQRGLRVDDILGRDISLQWAEALALVGATCRQMLATGAPGFPVASQVVLYSEGALAALATSDQHPVRGAVHLLTSLLADDVPARLRLLLLPAAGTGSAYPTLQAFYDALAYCERPDPQQILRALHDRALAAPARRGTDSVSPPLVSATAPATSPEQPPREGNLKRRWAIAAAATAVVLGLMWFLGPRLGEVRALAGIVTGSPSETASTAPAPERESTTSGVSARAASALPTNPKLSGSPPPGPNGGAPLTDRPTFELPVSDAAGEVTSIDRSALASTEHDVFANEAGEHAVGSDGAVYSRTDPDVVPPQSVNPKLPRNRPGVLGDGRTVLDLVISADGRVERVWLRTPPRDVHEFMLLSAAKAWRFDPATLHGRPVRFLYRVAITSLGGR